MWIWLSSVILGFVSPIDAIAYSLCPPVLAEIIRSKTVSGLMFLKTSFGGLNVPWASYDYAPSYTKGFAILKAIL